MSEQPFSWREKNYNVVIGCNCKASAKITVVRHVKNASEQTIHIRSTAANPSLSWKINLCHITDCMIVA